MRESKKNANLSRAKGKMRAEIFLLKKVDSNDLVCKYSKNLEDISI